MFLVFGPILCQAVHRVFFLVYSRNMRFYLLTVHRIGVQDVAVWVLHQLAQRSFDVWAQQLCSISDRRAFDLFISVYKVFVGLFQVETVKVLSWCQIPKIVDLDISQGCCVITFNVFVTYRWDASVERGAVWSNIAIMSHLVHLWQLNFWLEFSGTLKILFRVLSQELLQKAIWCVTFDWWRLHVDT